MPDGDREGLNERKALALMLAQPSMIERPALELGSKLLVGFKPEIYAKEVASSGGSRRGKSSQTSLAELVWLSGGDRRFRIAFEGWLSSMMSPAGIRPGAQSKRSRSIAARSFAIGKVSLPRIRFLISESPSSLVVFGDAMTCVILSPCENGGGIHSQATVRPWTSSIAETA
jgi:hypothetical protein